MTVGIYRLYNKVTGRIYVGKSKNIENRIKRHLSKIRVHNSDTYERMREDLEKYGEESFAYEILEECSLEEMDSREAYYAFKFDVFNPEKGYNTDYYHMKDYYKYQIDKRTEDEKQFRVYEYTVAGMDLSPDDPSALQRYFCQELGSDSEEFSKVVKAIDKCLKKEGYQSPINLSHLDKVAPLIDEYAKIKNKLIQLETEIKKEIEIMVKSGESIIDRIRGYF